MTLDILSRLLNRPLSDENHPPLIRLPHRCGANFAAAKDELRLAEQRLGRVAEYAQLVEAQQETPQRRRDEKDRVALFERLLEERERYKRVNQYK